MMRTRVRLGGSPAMLALLLAVAACGGTAQRSSQSSLAPTMIIERFLGAANQNDLDTMAALYGTREGAIADIWTREEIDGHMFLIASILRHSDYRLLNEQIVPGRRDVATQFVVRLTIGDQTPEVPFTLVQSARSGQWLIEKICIERVTRGADVTC